MPIGLKTHERRVPPENVELIQNYWNNGYALLEFPLLHADKDIRIKEHAISARGIMILYRLRILSKCIFKLADSLQQEGPSSKLSTSELMVAKISVWRAL